jgi:hypothetical protein
MRATSMNESVSGGSTKGSTVPAPDLVVAAQEVLEQGLGLLSSSAAKYSIVAPTPFDASIGQHFRHVVEHFDCLLQGAASGEVNYDERERNHRIESEVTYAGENTQDIIRRLRSWTNATLEQPCITVSSLAYHTDSPTRIASNLGRELAYCIGHAIHHFAIIRLLCERVGVRVSSEFGYAPSTLKYRSSLSAD